MLERERQGRGAVGEKGHSLWVQGLVHQLFWLLLLQNKQAQNVTAKTVPVCGHRVGTEQGQLGRCEVGGWAAAGWDHPGGCRSRVWQLRPRSPGCWLHASRGRFWLPHSVASGFRFYKLPKQDRTGPSNIPRGVTAQPRGRSGGARPGETRVCGGRS